MAHKIKVLKFGGTSMGTHQSLEKVRDIIRKNFEAKTPQAIVCSAMGGVTDQLFQIGSLAEKQSNAEAFALFEAIKDRHHQVAEAFGVVADFVSSSEAIFVDLKNLIQGLSMIHELSPRSLAYLTAFGEKLSTRLLASILKAGGLPAHQIDSYFIRMRGQDFQEDEIDWETTKSSVKTSLSPILNEGGIPIVTGFFGADENQVISLLGRGGSDYSAAILSVGLETDLVEIWTDVDGFFSADPRVVPSAQVISEIGFMEASELCSFGAKVLHPKTIRPVIERGGEVWIKNTFSPGKLGTKIIPKDEEQCHTVLSVTAKPAIILSLDLFGVSMGTSKSAVYRSIFDICNRYEICIDMIAASEAEVSFCIEARFAHHEDFFRALSAVAPLQITDQRSILCVVSPIHVKGRVGIAAGFFEALKEEGISIEMYSQNSLEVAQLMVVDQKDEIRSVRAIHEQFTQGSCVL
jgi:aspartate kinase